MRVRPLLIVACFALAFGLVACSADAPPDPVDPGNPADPADPVVPGGGGYPLPPPRAKSGSLPDIGTIPGYLPDGPQEHPSLAEGEKLFEQQNWAEAAAAYRKALGDGLGRRAAWRASNQIVICHLRMAEYDEAIEAAEHTIGRFLETVDEARAWRILGNLHLSLPHHGTEKGGRFHRGVYDQGIYRFSYRMDRALAVLCLERARELFATWDDGEKELSPEQAEAVPAERVEALFDLLNAVVSYGPYDSTWSNYWWAWTEFDPDRDTVDEELNPHGYGRGFHHGGEAGGPNWPSGLEVSVDGRPIFEPEPDSYDAALHPARKMKYLLSEIERVDPTDARDYAARARIRRATLAKNRYGTDRLNHWLNFWWNGKQPLAEQLKKYELHELGPDEALTLVGRRLAVIRLPEDEDPLKVLRSVGRDFPASSLRAEGRYAAGVYLQSRNQFPQAIAEFEALLAEFADQPRASSARSQIEALKAPEAVVDAMEVQLLGDPVTVRLTHRNIETVHLTAQRIDLARFVRDVWADIESDDEQKRYWRDPGNISYELLHRWQDGAHPWTRYVQGEAVPFTVKVESDPSHRYRQTEVPFPEDLSKKPGCFMVQVRSEDSLGSESRNLILIQDLALVEKKFKDDNLYLLADARTGQPVAGTVQVLQYWQQWIEPKIPGGQGKHEYRHRVLKQETDQDGIALFSVPDDIHPQAMAMAALPDGRLAFSGVRWFSRYSPSSRQSGRRALVFTDRPVYRPGHTVRVKVWLRDLNAGQYRDPSSLGGNTSWSITNPKGEVMANGTLSIDEFGGGSFDAVIPPKADEPPLGLYRIDIGGAYHLGGNNFRVEEYRKPEFEVTVEAGTDLARLGDEVEGHVEARYLFGAPVADGRVTYRIYREDWAQRYTHPGRWDWLYGPGYGWSYYDYAFYPWWGHWGCKRWVPWFPWKPERELVAEGEGRLDAEGRIPFTIDTRRALEDHPDGDHRYVVVAEVTDASRRTITGEGDVIVTRDEFAAFVDLQRGWVTPGSEIVVDLKTMTATGTPVASKGELTLARIRHTAEGDSTAIEKPESVQKVATDAEGHFRTTLRAEASGQFLIRYETTDSRGEPIFGSSVLWVCGADFEGALYRMNDLEILTDKRSYAPGETARVLINSDQRNANVLFASRTDRGVLLDYRMIRMAGKSHQLSLPIGEGDVPNFFVEGTTVFGGDVYQEVREVLVPPLESELEVEVTAADERVGPGEETRLTVKTTTPDGEPVRAQLAVSVFDRAVLQIQPEITPDIRKFFWGDRITHAFQMDTNLRRQLAPYGGRQDPRHATPGGVPEDWDGGFGNRWRNLQDRR